MRTPSAAYAVRCLHYSHAQSALLRSVVDLLLQLSLCGPSFGVYQFGTRFLGVVTSADVQLRALSVSIDAASTKMNGCQRFNVRYCVGKLVSQHPFSSIQTQCDTSVSHNLLSTSAISLRTPPPRTCARSQLVLRVN